MKKKNTIACAQENKKHDEGFLTKSHSISSHPMKKKSVIFVLFFFFF